MQVSSGPTIRPFKPQLASTGRDGFRYNNNTSQTRLQLVAPMSKITLPVVSKHVTIGDYDIILSSQKVYNKACTVSLVGWPKHVQILLFLY